MTRAVSKEEWKKSNEEFFNDMSGGFMLIETSKDDTGKIEALLGVEPGFFKAPTIIKTTEKMLSRMWTRK
jgi:hypothetical protein